MSKKSFILALMGCLFLFNLSAVASSSSSVPDPYLDMKTHIVKEDDTVDFSSIPDLILL